MVLNPDFNPNGESPPAHPYIYIRIIAIFHVNIGNKALLGPQSVVTPIQKDIVWVHWFSIEDSSPLDETFMRLDRLSLTNIPDTDSNGSIHPEDIVRTCHIIPAFHYGRMSTMIPPSIASESESYEYFYVNRFVVNPFG